MIEFVLIRVVNEKEKNSGTVPAESIEKHLKHPIAGQIPLDERAVLASVNQGVPLDAKLKQRSPGRELMELAEHVRLKFEGSDAADVSQAAQRSTSGIRALFGGTS